MASLWRRWPLRKTFTTLTLYPKSEAMTDIRAKRAIVDRGYRGRKFVDGTEILMPGRAPRGQSRATSTAMRKRFRRRAAIEPLLSHLKQDFRLWRCFLKVSKAINSI
jgi:IS5 family transposase